MRKHLFPSSIYILCLFGILLFSCKKNNIDNSDPVIPGDVFPIPSATPVNGSVSGRIVDENNAAVASASVVCAGITTVTDVNGFFNINNATLDKYITTVTVTKAGYFKGCRSFSANASRNYVHIKLIPKILSGTLASASAGIITLSNATEIRFQPNSMVIKSTGAVYNGTVNVYASYIDPTSADISSTVPGSFMGRDANNLYVLQSTGMIAVDIESPAGEVLQLAANLPATIKLPIPTSLISKAPATIDTWSLDEQGVWKKEGNAAKAGNYYEMQVTHFSFWNCDVLVNAVYLTLHVQDQNGASIPYIVVSLTTTSGNWWPTTYGATDGQGNVSGFVPSSVQLELNILSNVTASLCATGSVLYTAQNIGPFTTNTSLTVVATLLMQPGIDTLNVFGTANDCSGQPLANGTALIYSGQYYKYASIINGSYSTTIFHCTPIDSVNVLLMDNSNSVGGSTGTIAVSGNSVSIPAASLCLNTYDGIYLVTGSFYDISNASFTAMYPQHYSLVTLSANTVYVVNDDLNGGAPGYIFLNAGSGIYYGSFGLNVSFDPATNAVSEVHNYYGDPANPATTVGNPATGSGSPTYASSNGRTAVLDPSGINTYNLATKTIRIKYFMYHPAVVPNGPRAFFEETWTYIGPR